jgi:hypothetical protein
MAPRVALALADTQSYVLANNAIQACISRFDFNRVYVFTDAPQFWPNFQTVSVPKMQGIEDYNRIVLDELPKWVEEDFCLICQFDGFILDASAFSQDFYNFDYIGAVWPDYPHDRVGNGGFSWRSKKLLQAVAELNHLRQPGEAEDLFICRRLRSELEAHYGCVFADEQAAQRFSYEIIPHTQSSFGFHGIFNLPLVYRNDLQFLVENLPKELLVKRLPYLRFGGKQLNESQCAELERLISIELEKNETHS